MWKFKNSASENCHSYNKNGPCLIDTLRLHVKRQRSWFRHCAINRNVAGSIPGEIIGIFHSPKPSGRTMSMG